MPAALHEAITRSLGGDTATVHPVVSTPWIRQIKLVVDDGAAGDFFGYSVAVSGDTALVGAANAHVDGNADQGEAYVFIRNGAFWSLQEKLVADDGAALDFFGLSVALSGDTALVGAFAADVGDNPDQGAAYVFVRSGTAWSQQAKLTADDGGAFESFGGRVALSGNTALIAAPEANVGDDGFDQGAAYVFTRSGTTWSQQAKLVANDGAADDIFGGSVALSAGTALVGAPAASPGGSFERGAAYVFTRSGTTWSQQTKLTASDGAEGDEFGAAVALSGDTALVGARGDDGDRGSAYVFTRSGATWTLQAKLTADDGLADDAFGGAVALSGDVALVGAVGVDLEGDLTRGAAYVLTRSGATWSQQPRLTADDGAPFDFFGWSVALSGDIALVGVYRADVEGDMDRGAVYVFTPPFSAAALAVDSEPNLSDGNGTFEPGERVDIAPAWRNNDDLPHSLTGIAAAFVGPAGPDYTITADEASYGEVGGGQTASCQAADLCYAMELGPQGVLRPAKHWEASFEETLSDDTVRTWTLHIGDSFVDVPRANLFYRFIETLFHHGVTGGCSATAYCPGGTTTRDQMPVFVLKAREGLDYTPAACVDGAEIFDDVPHTSAFCPWIEELARRGVVAGCSGGNYCPASPVTRAQMAVFLLKTLEGGSYAPPPCLGLFTDVECPSTFAAWIEDLASRGVTGGCASNPPAYCPAAPVSRDQMATFVTKAFGLKLYGP